MVFKSTSRDNDSALAHAAAIKKKRESEKLKEGEDSTATVEEQEESQVYTAENALSKKVAKTFKIYNELEVLYVFVGKLGKHVKKFFITHRKLCLVQPMKKKLIIPISSIRKLQCNSKKNNIVIHYSLLPGQEDSEKLSHLKNKEATQSIYLLLAEMWYCITQQDDSFKNNTLELETDYQYPTPATTSNSSEKENSGGVVNKLLGKSTVELKCLVWRGNMHSDAFYEQAAITITRQNFKISLASKPEDDISIPLTSVQEMAFQTTPFHIKFKTTHQQPTIDSYLWVTRDFMELVKELKQKLPNIELSFENNALEWCNKTVLMERISSASKLLNTMPMMAPGAKPPIRPTSGTTATASAAPVNSVFSGQLSSAIANKGGLRPISDSTPQSPAHSKTNSLNQSSQNSPIPSNRASTSDMSAAVEETAAPVNAIKTEVKDAADEEGNLVHLTATRAKRAKPKRANAPTQEKKLATVLDALEEQNLKEELL